MARRVILWVAVVCAVVAVFLVGLGVGYALFDDGQGASAECLVLRKDLQDIRYSGVEGGEGSERAQEIIDLYNEMCR